MKQYTFCKMLDEELSAIYAVLERTPDFAFEVPMHRFNAALQTGQIQLWVEPDPLDPVAVMVTELHAGGGYALILAFAGVNVDTQRNMFASIRRWAARNGCPALRAVCKDAQARLFARDGFVKIAHVIELAGGDDHAA